MYFYWNIDTEDYDVWCFCYVEGFHIRYVRIVQTGTRTGVQRMWNRNVWYDVPAREEPGSMVPRYVVPEPGTSGARCPGSKNHGDRYPGIRNRGAQYSGTRNMVLCTI